MDEDTLNYLQSVDWEDFIDKLNGYAHQKITYSSCNRGPGRLPDGQQAKDVVMKAITLVYQGIRKWNRKKWPDFFLFLRSVVRSLISNALSGQENATSTSFDTASKLPNGIDPPSQYLTPLEILQQKEFFKKCASLVNSKQDDNLSMVFLALVDGYYTPVEISKEIGIEVSEVNNLLKRLRRLLKPLIVSPVK